jgi:hypothetical protein
LYNFGKICNNTTQIAWIPEEKIQPKYSLYHVTHNEHKNEPKEEKSQMVDSYHGVLRRLMAYVHEVDAYEKDHVFAQEELAALTPNDIKRWMCVKAYGTPEPGVDDHPTLCRSTSIEFWKKAISSFMPNRLMSWNVLNNVGNPTKSIEINDLIKVVKKKEVRKQGKTSTARRPLEHDEYQNVLSYLRGHEDPIKRYTLPGFFVFQYNMIARMDDTSKFKMDNLTRCHDFDFALKGRLNWSKNVHEERDAPNQILVGAMNRGYCVLLGLAIHLEMFIESGEGALTPLVFGIGDGGDDNDIEKIANKTNKKIQSMLQHDILNRPEFVHFVDDGPVGSHSVRKLAATHSRKNGCTKDEKDIRGRWKKGRRISDVYDDIDLPYPDAKVAGRLCIGGPCKYVLKEFSGITGNFLMENVVPSIRSRFSTAVASVLALPLLWAVFENGDDYLPKGMTDRIREAVRQVSQLPDDENPVKKVMLVISGNEGELYLDELDGDDGGDGGDGGGNRVTNTGARQAANERERMQAIYAQMTSLRRAQEAQTRILDRLETQRARENRVIVANLRRISRQPVVRNVAPADEEAGNNGDAQRGPIFAATLSANPRSLHVLWEEYERGIGGRRPAKLFTTQERGKVKHKYHRRKMVWDLISNLVRGGLTAQVAIDEIYDHYGRANSVTTIINMMKNDRRNGTVFPF